MIDSDDSRRGGAIAPTRRQERRASNGSMWSQIYSFVTGGTSPLSRGSHSGQIMVLSALFLTAMMGSLGLAVDLGYALSQRRSMQNAADAGALAGARIVARYDPSDPATVSTAQSDVEAVVLENAMQGAEVGAIACTYINDTGGSLGDCGGTVPSGATGVKVAVEEEHPTFFIRVIPGAPDTVTTTADASANIKVLLSPTDGPFLPCGIDTKLTTGGTMDIAIQSGGSWIVNPDAVGQTFNIHGPKIEKCDAKASRYKGLAEVGENVDRTAPGWFVYKEGDAAGTISADVEGADGCQAGEEVEDCVVFLPVAVNVPAEDAEHVKQLYVVFFAPFYVSSPKSNEHDATLLDDYIVFGRNQFVDWGWEQGYEGPISIRLTE